MTNRKKFGWLAFAALVVLAENAIFFSSQPAKVRGVRGGAALDAVFDGPRQSSEADALGSVTQLAVEQWLAAFPGAARNPFLTRAEAEGGASGFAIARPRLVGTLTSEGRRVAWLDSTARGEGEWIGEHQVRRIEGDRVVLARGTEELQLWLRPRGDEDVADGEGRLDEEEHNANE